jgi:hypothetical protein
MGWVDDIQFTNDREQTLYVAFVWRPDDPAFAMPTLELTDDTGTRVDVEQKWTTDDYNGKVFATRTPQRGGIRVRLVSGVFGLVSGSYSVCVTADPPSCGPLR